MSAFATWLASPPADAAIEITPEAIAVAALSTPRPGRRRAAATRSSRLPPGAVTASLTGRNIVDRRVVGDGAAQLRSAASGRGRGALRCSSRT